MKQAKAALLLHLGDFKLMQMLDDASAGMVIKALMNYVENGVEPGNGMDTASLMLFTMLKDKYDRDSAHYNEISERRVEAGKASGRARNKEGQNATDTNKEEAEPNKEEQTTNKTEQTTNKTEQTTNKTEQTTNKTEQTTNKTEQTPTNVNSEKEKEKETEINNSFLFAPDDKSPDAADAPETAKARDNPSGDKAAKIDFDFNKKEWVNITDEWIAFWRKTYPAVDIQAELLRMASWLVANPTKKKKNYPRAIDFWLGEAQDRGGRRNGRTQFRPVAGAGRLDPGGRPEVIRGADYGTGANIYDFIGGGGDKESGNS